MALGHLLWVSWICLLLFNHAAGVRHKLGYAPPSKHDSKNILDEEEELMASLLFDDYDLSFDQSPHSQPGYVPAQERVPDAGTLGGGQTEDWSQALVFPLNPNYQLGDPAQAPLQPVQPQPAHGDAASKGISTFPGSHGAGYDGPAVPVSTSQAENVYPGSNFDHSITPGDQTYAPHLVYEEVFQYPPSSESANVNTAVDQIQSPPSEPLVPNYAPVVRPKPVSRPGKGKKMPSSKVYLSIQYEPANTKRPRRIVKPQYAVVPRKTSYIIQSRGGYQRKKTILSRTSYSPDMYPSLPVSLPRRRHAAPKFARTPQM